MASLLNASTTGLGGLISTGDSSGSLALQTGGTTALTINSSQNVGIGTTSPASILQVSATTPLVKVTGTSTTASSQDFTTNSAAQRTTIGVEQSAGGGLFVGSSAYAAVFGSAGASSTQFATNNTIRATIDTSGNVGIGTTTPAGALDVSGSGNIYISNKTSAPTNTAQVPGTLIFAGTGWNTQVGSQPIAGQIGLAAVYGALNGGSTEPAITFSLQGTGSGTYNTTAGPTTLTERMRLDNYGRLGIGTTTPNGRLHLGLTGVANANTTAISNMTDFASSGRAGFDGLTNNNDGIYFGMGINGGINAGLGFFREAAGWNSALAFYTNNVTDGVNVSRMQEKMRITSNGMLQMNGGTVNYAGTSIYAIDIRNTNMTTGSTGFDSIGDNSDGGGTSWQIVKDSVIDLFSTSGGHGGTWGFPVNVEAGYWRIKGSVRLSSTNGSIHPATPAGNYQYSIAFQFYISSGPDTGLIKWSVDTLGNGTRATFTSAPVYLSAGNKQVNYATNGYEGVKEVYITQLFLERVA